MNDAEETQEVPAYSALPLGEPASTQHGQASCKGVAFGVLTLCYLSPIPVWVLKMELHLVAFICLCGRCRLAPGLGGGRGVEVKGQPVRIGFLSTMGVLEIVECRSSSLATNAFAH